MYGLHKPRFRKGNDPYAGDRDRTNVCRGRSRPTAARRLYRGYGEPDGQDPNRGSVREAKTRSRCLKDKKSGPPREPAPDYTSPAQPEQSAKPGKKV